MYAPWDTFKSALALSRMYGLGWLTKTSSSSDIAVCVKRISITIMTLVFIARYPLFYEIVLSNNGDYLFESHKREVTR